MDLPMMVRSFKTTDDTEHFAFFSNGTIRQIGGTERNWYRAKGVEDVPSMSANEHRICVATTKFVFGAYIA